MDGPAGVPAIPLQRLLAFIEEDAPWGDATSDAVVPAFRCSARIRAKDTGVIAGLAEARALFEHYGVSVTGHAADGEAVENGRLLLDLDGSAQAVLLVERTALNIIGRMSGIATRTRAAVESVRAIDPGVRVAATRKTAPGCRLLDKKAVVLGGGDPHRYSLSDMILIKDNHLVLVPLRDAVLRARAASVYRAVEVEVESVKDAVTAAECGADIILLDNMPPERVKEAVRELHLRDLRKGIVLEVSGNITGETVLDYCSAGIDVISMGSLTHTVKNFDVSLEIIKGTAPSAS